MRGIAQTRRRGSSLSFTPDSITAGPFLAVHRVMKPAQLGSLNADLAPIEEDLAARIGTIFDRCPQLFGFTVQDSSSLPEELRAIALERELVVSDIGVYPYLNADQCEQIYNEIAVALLDFMFERPAAKDVLRGRTFVRTLH
jgi:hypothetical protein